MRGPTLPGNLRRREDTVVMIIFHCDINAELGPCWTDGHVVSSCRSIRALTTPAAAAARPVYHKVTYNELTMYRPGGHATVVIERGASVLASVVRKRVAALSRVVANAKQSTSAGRNDMPTFHRILLCYDGTREGQHALKDGACLAQELHAQVHVLSVLNHSAWMQGADITSSVSIEFITESARGLLDEGLQKLAARGLTATGHFAVGDPLDQIPLLANELNVDLIVVGHRHSSRLARWWGGRSDGLLLDRVSCSVLITMGPESVADSTVAGEATRPAEHL